MTEAARADTRASVGARLDVKNDIVGVSRISRHPSDRPQMVESEGIANPPGNHVVGAGRIAANADAAEFDAATTSKVNFGENTWI